jgi:hypothetical protein
LAGGDLGIPHAHRRKVSFGVKRIVTGLHAPLVFNFTGDRWPISAPPRSAGRLWRAFTEIQFVRGTIPPSWKISQVWNPSFASFAR